MEETEIRCGVHLGAGRIVLYVYEGNPNRISKNPKWYMKETHIRCGVHLGAGSALQQPRRPLSHTLSRTRSFYVYIYVYIYIYVCMYIYIYIYMYTCTYI